MPKPVLQVLLEVKAKEEAAETVKAVVMKVKEKAEKIVFTIGIEQTAAMKLLAEAEPELLAAETALQVCNTGLLM